MLPKGNSPVKACHCLGWFHMKWEAGGFSSWFSFRDSLSARGRFSKWPLLWAFKYKIAQILPRCISNCSLGHTEQKCKQREIHHSPHTMDYNRVDIILLTDWWTLCAVLLDLFIILRTFHRIFDFLHRFRDKFWITSTWIKWTVPLKCSPLRCKVIYQMK